MPSKKEISDACGEVKEYLTLNKFNDAMKLMAQITVAVIDNLIDEALIISKGYEEDLKTLVASNIISKSTEHNFKMLIVSGVQANNGIDIPKDHANTAYEVLVNEIEEVFNNEIIPADSENKKEKSRVSVIKEEDNSDNIEFEYNDEDEKEPYGGDFTRDLYSAENKAFLNDGNKNIDFREHERKRQEKMIKEKKRFVINKSGIIVFAIPIILILVIVFFIKSCFSRMDNSGLITNVETTTMEIEITTEIETTEEETTSEAGMYRVRGDVLNIRDQASIEGTKIVGRLQRGAVIQVVKFYNNDWAIVRYEGKEAFVSRQYIERDDSVMMTPEYEEN